MGTRPREIEAASLLRLEKILGPHFEMRRLHELTADRAIRPLGGTHQAEALGNNAQIGHYLPLQVKACESDVATWLRFLKFKLRKAQQSLCGVVVLGIHRDRSSLLIVHTHAHDHWTLQNLADEKFWFCRKKAIPRLLELWRQLAAPLATIQHRFVTSAAQLVEARMRQAFRETLEKLSMKLQEPPAEFSEIDGYIECETSGGTRRFSVQERTCKWRRVRGKFAGQFASLRRSSGKHFSTGIDFLALHVRADPQEQFGYSGTYLIPAAELARRGYLAEASDKYSPPKSIDIPTNRKRPGDSPTAWLSAFLLTKQMTDPASVIEQTAQTMDASTCETEEPAANCRASDVWRSVVRIWMGGLQLW